MAATANPSRDVFAGQLAQRRRLTIGAGLILAVLINVGGVRSVAAQNSPRGRFALFGTFSQRTDDFGQSFDYTDLVGRFNLESDRSQSSLLEYAFDARYASYPSTDRDSVFSLYEAYVGLRTKNDLLQVRIGQQWIRELGGLGSIGGLSVEYRVPGESPLGNWRFAVFGGLEPQYYSAGYVDDVTKGGAFVALDGSRGRRHVLGWVAIRNADLTERSVAVFNNYFSFASKFYIYQALEYDLSGPAGLGDGGLTYLLVNLRYRPVDYLEIQGSYRDGRSIDARTITEDAIAGRPVNPETLEGLLFESGRFRLTWIPRAGIRIWAGVGSDKYSRDDGKRDSVQFGAFFSNLLGSGFDLSGASTQYTKGEERYDALYFSVGRSVGRSTYLSFDYSKALAYYRYDTVDGGEVVSRPNSDRFSLSANVNLSRALSLLLTGEFVDQDNAEELRAVVGIVYRF